MDAAALRDHELSDFFATVVGSLPPVEFAAAYGSAAFPQTSCQEVRAQALRSKMVDFIFAVDDAFTWHRANLAANRAHYSFVGALGPAAVVTLQRSLGAGVYFNTYVPMWCSHLRGPRMIKYGVIGREDLIRDLEEWDSLYVGGRLHKPVHTITTTETVERARATNLRAAVAAALLCLPAKFERSALFRTIASLSYSGDVRMGVAEDPEKVRKIVDTNEAGFASLYSAPLEHFSTIVSPSAGAGYEQDMSGPSTAALLGALPTSAQLAVQGCSRMAAASLLRAHLAAVVRRATTGQTAKGLFTAGLQNAVRYGLRKVRKAQGAAQQST